MAGIKSIGILTSGGDAPGMNAAIRAVTRSAIYNGFTVKGIMRGFKGLVFNEIVEFKSQSVSNIIQLGGTILKTARSEEFMGPAGRAKALGTCKLLGHVVNTGHGVPNTSYIKLQRGDEVLEDVAIGTGPLDASFQAINRMLGMEDIRLESFSLNAVTDGEDAVGEAVVKLEDKNGATYTGTGLSTDIIESSIRAYVNGINKMMEAAN